MAHVLIDTATNHGFLLQNSINHYRAALEGFRRVQAIHLSLVGAPVVEENLEGAAVGLGIPVGGGEATYANVGSIITELESAEAFVAVVDQGN